MSDISNLQIQRLQEKTGCSREKAKEALSQGDGSLLEGLLYLERRGHAIPVVDGFYSSERQHLQRDISPYPSSSDKEYTPLSTLEVFKKELLENYLEVRYQHKRLGHIPVICFLFLMPLSYGSVLPVLVLPMFFGVYYRFSSAGSFLAEFNPVAGRMARTLTEITRKLLKIDRTVPKQTKSKK